MIQSVGRPEVISQYFLLFEFLLWIQVNCLFDIMFEYFETRLSNVDHNYTWWKGVVAV